MLVARLKKVLPHLISPGQSAFLLGRLIQDDVLLLNGMVDLAKKRTDESLFFKVDFEKAYDSVSWSCLEYMMGRM